MFYDDFSGLAAGLDPTASHFAGVSFSCGLLFPYHTTQRDADVSSGPRYVY